MSVMPKHCITNYDLIVQGFSASDVSKFTTFGLFHLDAEVTSDLLSAAWHMDGGEDGRVRCDAVLAAFESSSLIKRGQGGRILLHDLALDLARVSWQNLSNTASVSCT